jgi:Pyridoxamine 5'-phosphate oxidase
VSVTVALDELRARSAEFGEVAFLLTVTDDRRPHVVSVKVAWDGDALVAGAGRTTSANVAGQPTVSMLWAPPARGDYSLIVDGTAETQERDNAMVVVIRPSRAVLHRVANADGDGPSCVTLL